MRSQPSQSVRHSAAAPIAASLAAVLLLAVGCGNDREPLTADPLTSPMSSLAGAVSPEAARQLCEQLQPKVDQWTKKRSPLAKSDLNFMVSAWATQANLSLADLLRQPSVIDDVTSRQCPETRRSATDYFETTSLGQNIVGFAGP